MAGPDVPNFFNDDSDGEDDEFEFANTGRNGLIFMVDCSASMFEAQDGADPPASNFSTILECVEQTMKNLVLTSAKTLMGIVFYNVRLSPDPKMEVDEMLKNGTFVVPEKTAIFIPMTVLSADVIKYVRHIKESVDFFDFENRYGHTDDCSFANALWLCSRLKSSCGYKLQSCKLMIFTDKNSPHEPGTPEFQHCFVRAKDLNAADIMCVLVPMVEAFSTEVFYTEFLCTALDCDVEELEQANPTRDIETLTKRIFRQDHRKRVNYHLQWELGGGLELGVGVYGLTRHKLYMKKVSLQSDTNEVIVAKRTKILQILDEHDQEEVESRRLQPGEVKHQIFMGDEFVTLSSEEYQNMLQMTRPGCQLLGFKPLSALNLHLHTQGPLFLFADETLIKGSSRLFASLWKRCLAKEQVAICLLTLRRGSWPKFVALVPQTEVRSGDNDLVRSDGFRVEFLPNSDEIRQLSFDLPDTPVATEKLELMKKLTKKLRFRYNPSQFEDPTLITRYTNMEAIVFETDRVLEFEDTTLPDREYQDRKIQQLVQDMAATFGEDLQIGGAKKRRDPNEDGPREKRARNNNESPPDVLEAVRMGKGSSLTVAMLRQYLTTLGCTNLSKMNKADLIGKVAEMDVGV